MQNLDQAQAVRLEALPLGVLGLIVREVVAPVEGKRSGLRILPRVSRALLRRLQSLSLPIGRLRGQEALRALDGGGVLKRLASLTTGSSSSGETTQQVSTTTTSLRTTTLLGPPGQSAWPPPSSSVWPPPESTG